MLIVDERASSCVEVYVVAAIFGEDDDLPSTKKKKNRESCETT
jgi:hypothetical protein